MTNDLGRLNVERKSGAERFREGSTDLGVDLLDFWRWSASDLVSNATRGRLAEYLVARAIGVATDGVRDEWAAFDLAAPTGIKVEVKSAAFIQTWHQARLSSVSFLTPKTRAWDAESNAYGAESRRQADVYVFALLGHTDKSTVDPLDVSQWRFYVLPTSVIDARTRSQHSITLKTLETLCRGCVLFASLAEAVAQAGEPALQARMAAGRSPHSVLDRGSTTDAMGVKAYRTSVDDDVL